MHVVRHKKEIEKLSEKLIEMKGEQGGNLFDKVYLE